MTSGWGRLAADGGERLGAFAVLRAFFRPGRPMKVGADSAEEAALRGGTAPAGSSALLEIRHPAAAVIPDAALPLSVEDAALMRAAQADVRTVLGTARGRRLTPEELIRLVRGVNPTMSSGNCLEGSLALDAMFRGEAVVAGPGHPVDTEFAARLLERHSMYRVPRLRADELSTAESQLTSFGSGARGIILRRGAADEGIPSHTYNVVNFGGRIRYLDGQVGKVFDRHPARGELSTYDFFRTA
ncbi:toxin glutamine deamidase domain-containing protein [Actinoallomurus acaciae]|uniref:Toxin glutamine deamidase domain-containing protein n=1 Tax=Actinoallomurus acaciae TaxID=502577 RepID=A0ABV5YQA2_9ACTN